ncbi:MAG: hypothetical protein QOK05_1380 [Chloroflexota bacterium]|nr:hypothetical protein [Chloroflexota bacterium]
MTLLVRNEEDIIEDNLRFHLDRGVDFFIVTDNASTDGTSKILSRWVEAGLAEVIVEHEDNYAQDVWVTRMARRAAQGLGADWVINSDADEFWWPLKGSIKDAFAAIPARFTSVQVPRVNYRPSSAAGPWHQRMIVRDVNSVNATGRPLPAKVCHRGAATVDVAPGNHAVGGLDGLPWEGASPMIILHFPLRDFERFEQKITQGTEAVERNPAFTAEFFDAWRHLYELARSGKLRDYWDSQLLDDAAASDGVRAGRLVVDTRVATALRDPEGDLPEATLDKAPRRRPWWRSR